METKERAGNQYVSMICKPGPFGIYQLDRECMPDEWKDLPGRPKGASDARYEMLVRWIRENLTQSAAPALNSNLFAGNKEGAITILKADGCPLK